MARDQRTDCDSGDENRSAEVRTLRGPGGGGVSRLHSRGTRRRRWEKTPSLSEGLQGTSHCSPGHRIALYTAVTSPGLPSPP